MKAIYKVLFSIFLFVLIFFGIVIFGGYQFCLPGLQDNGPGSVGCFYSQ